MSKNNLIEFEGREASVDPLTELLLDGATPYAQALLKKRGPPPPESDAAEFAQRILELESLY